jgi:hypothetical protein
MLKTADFSGRVHAADRWWLDGPWLRRVLAKSKVCSRSMIVRRIGSDSASQVSFV